jgi:DNA repair protein RecO (recombination protein O)
VPSSGIAAFPPPADIVDGFRLTGYFLDRHVFTPRGLPIPEARARFITAAVSNSVSRPV